MLSELRARVAVRWREKLILSIALPLYFAVLYFALQRFVMIPPRELTPTAVDRWIAFTPAWTAVYQSIYLFLPVPWLCTSAGDLQRYRYGFFTMTAVAFAFFLFVPVAGPRPSLMPDHDLYRLLVKYDANINAFPSLHVAFTVYTLLLAIRLIRHPLLSATVIVWGSLIIYSTMAIKQHWAVDVAAGLVLALAADLFARSLTTTRKGELPCADSSLDPAS